MYLLKEQTKLNIGAKNNTVIKFGKSEAKNITNNIIIKIKEVPKSGSKSTKTKGKKTIKAPLKNIFQLSRLGSEIDFAKNKTVATFANSDGWNRKGPNISQRREPFISGIKKTTTNKSNEKTYIGTINDSIKYNGNLIMIKKIMKAIKDQKICFK